MLQHTLCCLPLIYSAGRGNDGAGSRGPVEICISSLSINFFFARFRRTVSDSSPQHCLSSLSVFGGEMKAKRGQTAACGVTDGGKLSAGVRDGASRFSEPGLDALEIRQL